MKWCDPVLVAIDEEDMRELVLAMAYEEAWAEYDGFENFVVETAASHGVVARVVELRPELAEVSDEVL